MSPPTSIQLPLMLLYTLTRPLPLSYPGEPTATKLPSLESDTDLPVSSFAAAASMDEPSCSQVALVSLYWNTRAHPPEFELLTKHVGAPITTTLPAWDSDTDEPA